MPKHRFAAALAALMIAAPAARAEDMTLKDGRHWITVASAQDKDQAIGIARLYGADARVVASRSGWYGVALGPVRDKSLASFVKTWQGWPEIPKDAVFSIGAKFTGTVWVPDRSAPESVEVAADAGKTVTAGDFAITAKIEKQGEDQILHVDGSRGTERLFSLATPKDFYTDGATLLVAPLDPASPAPEALATQFTGGAHCCVASWFATETQPGTWQLLDTEPLDGGGYWLEDVDGDGSYELLSVDNAFLYAFDSYAGSFAPLVIAQLRGEDIAPMAKNEAWRTRIAQELAGYEFQAKLQPDLWQSNGFLAAWVAIKVELGQGDEAWARMLKSYQKVSDFGPQVCTSGEKVEDCPVDNLKAVPFPEALGDFLKSNGYTPVPGG